MYRALFKTNSLKHLTSEMFMINQAGKNGFLLISGGNPSQSHLTVNSAKPQIERAMCNKLFISRNINSIKVSYFSLIYRAATECERETRDTPRDRLCVKCIYVTFYILCM